MGTDYKVKIARDLTVASKDDAIAGRDNPAKRFDPVKRYDPDDGRITDLELHLQVDDAVGYNVTAGLWWQKGGAP